MVVNNSSQASRNIRKKSWLASGDDSDTWNQEILSQHSSDISGSVEKSIMLKNDFMDLRSFAYYGSLGDLIQNTVLSIISTYPYELYYDTDLQRVEVKEGINSVDVDPLKRATVGGILYYYNGVTIQPHRKFILLSSDSVILTRSGNTWRIQPNNYVESGDIQIAVIVGKKTTSSSTTVDYQLNAFLRKVSNPGEIDIHNTSSGGNDGKVLGHFYNDGYTNYEIFRENNDIDDAEGFAWSSFPEEGDICPKALERISTITIRPNSGQTITLYAHWDNDLNIIYVTEYNDKFHIRPKSDNGYYDDFVDNLDLFGKCLVGVYSGIRNTAKFEVLRETDNGTAKDAMTFTIPSGPGDYNINSDSFAMRGYISELGRIGIRYDELYTDNLLRMMTHDSLKNLDWTNGFNGEDGEGNEYMKTGEKFSSVIRIMGYTFDQEKAYIDSIGNVNTVTYSNRDNLSDYFLTDSLEDDGICVNTIYPYSLTEYKSDGTVAPPNEWNIYNQFGNTFTRKFSENTAEIISPYSAFTGAFYTRCVGDAHEVTRIPDNEYFGQDYYVDNGKAYNIMTDYRSFSEMTVPDVNNEFMKRFRINSRQILRKKGTIDGIESVLSLFGMRSKRWCGEESDKYDFDITETTYFTGPMTDTMDDVHGMYKIDWYNSCKTIPYETQSYINGEYIPYQGLPVSYREVDDGNGGKERKLYPFFQQSGIYDGNMYYQMNGGWIGYLPYRFDIDDKFLVYNNGETRVETMRNVMQVKNMTELLSQPMGDLYNEIIYYVTDISEKFALINGYPYKLKEESVGSDVRYYFEVSIYGGGVSIGGDLYEGVISVSDKNGSLSDYNLSLYEDGTTLRVYYTGSRDMAFEIELDGYSPDTSLIFIDGNYNGDDEHVSHYFMLKDVNFSGMIGEGFWEEIQNDTRLYQEIENITDNTLGNNPHSGNFSYDNGEEYLNRYRKIFKYASEYRQFNESCFADVSEAYDEIDEYGFHDLMLMEDSKVHSFVDRINEDGTETKYDMNDKSSIYSILEYADVEDVDGADGVTSQIINTKKIDITFYIHFSTVYGKGAQEEIKYIQCKIMPYVEQMIPSTSIVDIHFVPREITDANVFDETFDYTFG